MSEYIYTDLPRYVKTTPRENFANSVVKDGSVLLFSEDEEKLVAKLPDGTFKEIGGGSSEYYRCASVDPSAKTWTGYKAVLNDGIYTFEDTVTSGLSYTSVTPVVGNIYSADVLAKVSSLYQGIPVNGLIFYAPLEESKATTETGELIEEYNAEYTVKNGIPCFHSTQNGYLRIRNLEDFRNAYNAGTFACSFFGMYESGSVRTGFTFIGSSNRSTYPLAAGSTNFSQADNCIWEAPEYTNEMIHVVFTSSQYLLKVYVNGEKVDEGSLYTPSITATNALTIGGLPGGWIIDNIPDVEKYIGYIGAIRFYNRSLEENEILALAGEFTILDS